jgi:hypothetical protein
VGTAASPLKIICVDNAGTVPPVSADLRTTATITTTGAFSIILIGDSLYCYGISFYAGTGAVDASISLHTAGGTDFGVYEACSFNIPATGTASSFIRVGATTTNAATKTIWDNCTVSFGATAQSIVVVSYLEWKNTPTAITGATIPTNLFYNALSTAINSIAVVDGVDLSAAGAGKTLVAANTISGEYIFKNCKLGGSVTVAATPTVVAGAHVSLCVSDSGDTGYRQERYQYEGTLSTETTIVRTSGASDGQTSVAWKMVSSANSEWHSPLKSFEIAIWNTAVGSSKTATIEIVNDGVTLQSDDIWMDVQYLGTAGFPLASKATTRADVLSAGANLTTSAVTWTTTGLGSPVKQYMQATFTPQEIGYIRATVYVARASTTVYIDPVITIA